ncbi:MULTISPECIES: protein kinase domain-containing protein [Oscillatoriophycideae]|jgi:serine/threonine protein kinase|uniref:Kinase domain protein n=2 Tax=Microcystis TaxID=1125 RepID=L7E9M6_MICAE|nr:MULTISPECIES: protein kinase [Oscillatoriophycideae]ELP55388.1 kinase domain protein [Microcystis aeruginosa TAIHU98]
MLDQMMKMLEGQQIGSYRLNKFLGAGSFGGVFHASEMVRNTSVQEVAIKVIPESSDDKLIELQNARKLEHSNLIKAYSVGEFRFLNTEMLYLVMELAQGSLENHIAKGSLSSGEIKNITAQVAQGLSYLHSQNKVHRDLKPGNILKINQQYKLADFGLIRTLNNKSHTQTVNNGGTIIYMPPEAFKGDISAGWDMWSLGIMLIEMTTNQFPYKFDNDINQLMARVMNCDLQIPTLPREFKPIIEGCLQKDRRQRWTAQQVLNALQPQVTGKMPVSQIPLKTAKADFTQLDRYLKNGQWREADLETGMVILKIVNKTHGSLTKENCENFPREELQIIDSLWLKYSSGKFGFSVQKKIWIECGGEVGVRDFHIWRKFADKIGWRNSMGDWLFPPTEFTYNINAPRGNLPCWEIFDLEESEDMKYQQYTYTLRNVLASMEDDGLLGGSLFLSRL